MRSIQYEKTEEKTNADTAGRRSGIKESNKVGAKKCVCGERRRERKDAEDEGETDEKTKGRTYGLFVKMKEHPRWHQWGSGPLQGHTHM